MINSINKENLIGEYKSRINRVLDYIDKNISKSLSLDELTSSANFSKYHFHRIFYSMIGENLFQFLQRLRLEKAAFTLLTNPKKSITEIALDCGFSSSAVFARSFKNNFKMSASNWRKKKDSNLSKMNNNQNQVEDNKGKELPEASIYIEYKGKSQIWKIEMDNVNRIVEVKEIPEITIAYIRHFGAYKGDVELFRRLANKLIRWAGARDLINFPDTKFIIIYHDEPEITHETKLRTSVCITVPEDVEVGGEIGKMEISSGKYAVCLFEVNPTGFQEAWDWFYGSWLPQSGYVPDDKPAFELYPYEENKRTYTGKEYEKVVVDIYLPVKPL